MTAPFNKVFFIAATLVALASIMQTQDVLADAYPRRIVCPFSLLDPARDVTSWLLAGVFIVTARNAKENPANKKYRPWDILICIILTATPVTRWSFPEAHLWVQGISITLAGGWMAYRLLRSNTALKPLVSMAWVLCMTAFLGAVFFYHPYKLAYPQDNNGGVFNPCANRVQEGMQR